MSTYGASRPVEDLTARARIVDAALVLFADRGVARTTMRSIAQEAGVSVGSIQHHFDTKDGLRQACDERALAVVADKLAGDRSGELGDPDFLMALRDATTPVVPYVASITLERDDGAARLFDAMVGLTSSWLVERWPERYSVESTRGRDVAAALVAITMGPVVLHHQLSRVMGHDGDEQPSPRLGMATLDAFWAMGDYLGSSVGRRLHDAADVFYEEQST